MINEFKTRLTDTATPLRIHLIGVAGSGMSGLALILMEMGHRVSGSDRVTSTETERLQNLGLSFSSPHTAEAVQDADLVIYSSAIKENNPSLAAARALNISCMRRAECLASILNAKKGIIVAGTHGKTTTSSLSAHLLREGRMRPCHYVGAEIPVLGANAHWTNQSEYLVAEGDESDGTLVNYVPEHSIILNIEAEHLDFYKDLNHIKTVFHQLCKQTNGTIFYCSVDEGAKDVCSQYPNTVSYGWSDADYTAENLRERRGYSAFTVMHQGQPVSDVELGIPGRHNVLNALAAIALVRTLGVDFNAIASGLASFAGAKRRFETKYLSPSYRIVDDYGHHPTEIAATLQTARSLKPGRLIILFQPHRYTRTQLLADDFGRVLQEADLVYVTDVYPASEPPIEGVTGQYIVDHIHKHGPTKAEYVPLVDDAHRVVGNALRPGDLLITLGAGNVHEAGTRIAKDLSVLEEMSKTREENISAKLYEPLGRHTSMGVGGRAQYYLVTPTIEAFQSAVNYCRDRNIPIQVLGSGTNVIVRDGGIRGAVIHLRGDDFDAVTVNQSMTITAGANVKLKRLASTAMQANISDFEWMDGIPGCVGGSLRMNAGAMGDCMWEHLVCVQVLDEDGRIQVIYKKDLTASYRSISYLIHNFVLSATFTGIPQEDMSSFQAKLAASRDKRRATQPGGMNAGCVFKNPEGASAGQIIDELGMKGLSVGDAQVSDIHANFIINKGHARATDITELINIIRKRVMDERSIELKEEVQVIGDREYQF